MVQNDVGNKYSPTIIVAAVTSQTGKAKLPTHVELQATQGGLSKNSVVLLEQLRTIDKMCIRDRAWSIPSSGMATFGEGAAEGSYAWNTNMFAGCSDVDFGSNSKMPQANVEGGTAYVYYQKGSNSGGETHTHTTPTQWTTSEKEHWYVCSECNQEIVGSRKAHSTAAEPNKATCQKAATCDVCGKTYGEKAAHVADTTKWVYDRCV